MRGWQNILHANTVQKTMGVYILRSDKIDFKTEIFMEDKEVHYIMIKEWIHQGNITII